MPAERLSMRQIREVLRLRYASKLPQRSIAKSLGLSQGAVSGYLSRARAAGVVWPLPEDLDDVQLEALLFPPPPALAADQRPVPDWAWVHRELRRPDVTLALLWEEYRAGAPAKRVSNNPRAGTTKACSHEPMVTRTYADMARHYGTAIVPARPYKPRDKAKVEVGVQIVGRWILARLRHRRFFSLAELNAAIRALLDELNDRPMRGWGMSRRALFQQLDKPALRSLPPLAYEYAEWKRCRVGLDYHVEIAKHYYSVPHQLIRQEVEARITATTVEIFHRGKRVASHRRSLRR